MPIIDVKSEITGNVWKIVAQVGDVVEEEAPIMILESMKMEIPVTAPETGTLVEICVTEGSTCSEGAVVARLQV
ncbi:MAG: acetyl-CoA carboxylase biotin carboxyl carrier protein subunit [Rhodocyclaceae bacterium]|nr:acetyl-CoA carboxylase biotin carboxyl carrier protein subunit [Rhodocyclaceae bacterium]MCA3076828.1 acetyl-CoA carboxylase biotin carboxyl carrier protein subunit [Rhodocyclaceae bacterium]MCA3089646.1 acetyl-CoA carboxylase biotin carboxyl carrier protein subunit [Rhodocyclaceae bacterium]MCA3094486.1 acetyl-CoA carboxylase biotin carboxyl carrier protein subunit [Rhodocyclaceae bacterium]MCA3098134.1 acetyl-CoA carboxylase biotin carboxyl carrier protein subunit [Rhodocyclaceae bacterium